ncbi:TPA: hypothetical protein M4213_005173 [Klebsiella pneumoniae]|uniref:hypothetical protein n=1 Tax=Klebsiella pneumoniae complex TaxID=3390273 RepID=UPI0013D03372|nr:MULTISPECIES: hypothetical protein [Klebsiella]MCC4979556.1 hypothetical protein [Klebsiella pneumoniae]HBQ2314637.1 hypothetical protein [Klebsiella variicola]HBQ2319480.1 hypothetical protein [Klebsiella pneumoniae]HBR4210578.1 hypothetical protein [Klebsiella pneumoniae]HBY1570382.1 hypothetical protein [Klebsiella pneumoniae]
MLNQWVHSVSGRTFSLHISKNGEDTVISVLENGKQVGPTYSVTNEVVDDYRKDTGKNMIDELKNVAKSDLDRWLG